MIRTIGIMTGNSLDAVDAVITEFDNGNIHDICGFSVDIPKPLADDFRALKAKLSTNNGNIEKIIKEDSVSFTALHNSYINLVALTVEEVIQKANLKKEDINAIGFHGQTCAHCPPSIAKAKGKTYTLQIGSGQMLADLTQIPVVFDFRSDDLMNGGEGAPLAPIHNLHIAKNLKKKGLFPVAFCNAGNTGNISIISQNFEGKEITIGFDVGPCNHFIDYLARTEKNVSCDYDGKFGIDGKINKKLLKALFNKAVVTKNDDNYLMMPPPKSSDPGWYKIIPELTNSKTPFKDRIRTAEYFSAYLFVHALDFIKDLEMPKNFLIFGGGWQNPILLEDFKKLIKEKIKDASIEWSDTQDYSGKYMEARIFADMAKCKLQNEPFTFPETTGCKTPTVCGIIAKPGDNNPQLYSRAAKGLNKP